MCNSLGQASALGRRIAFLVSRFSLFRRDASVDDRHHQQRATTLLCPHLALDQRVRKYSFNSATLFGGGYGSDHPDPFRGDAPRLRSNRVHSRTRSGVCISRPFVRERRSAVPRSFGGGSCACHPALSARGHGTGLSKITSPQRPHSRVHGANKLHCTAL